MGNSPPSLLDVSGDISPTPTDRFHLGPGSLSLHIPTVLATFLCSPVCVHQRAIAHRRMPSASHHHVPVWGQILLLLASILHDTAQRNEPWLLFPFALVGSRKRSEPGPGGGHADEARKAHWFLRLVLGCGRAAAPRERLAAPLKPPAPSACQLLSLLQLPTRAAWVGGRTGAMLRLRFGGTVSCLQQGWVMCHPCSFGRQIFGAVAVSCGPQGLPPLFHSTW